MEQSTQTQSLPWQQMSPSSRADRDEEARTVRPDMQVSWWSSEKQRVCVLAGSAIAQLPIWGFAMTYGILQEHYNDHWTLAGPLSLTGIIGTTSNGIMYLSMPFLFALFTQRLASHRQLAASVGALLASTSFFLSSFSRNVWHLFASQAVFGPLGCTLMYSPITLSLGERFDRRNRTCNRAIAYGVVLSAKNIVGSTCPFLFRCLLDRYGFRTTLRVWAAITLGSGLLTIWMVPGTPRTTTAAETQQRPPRRLPWHFLRHRTFYVYSAATLLQSAGYGIPQTYLSEYARDVSRLSKTFSTLLLTLMNIPGIASSSFFGFLSDNKQFPLSATTVTAGTSACAALSAFLFWGLAAQGSVGLLVVFAIGFGFFASGYSATWGGMMNEMEAEAVRWNEAIDTGLLYGLLNGARGLGYLSGGLLSVPLLKAGRAGSGDGSGYGTSYGALIVFTGLSLAFGGWSIVFKWRKLACVW